MKRLAAIVIVIASLAGAAGLIWQAAGLVSGLTGLLLVGGLTAVGVAAVLAVFVPLILPRRSPDAGRAHPGRRRPVDYDPRDPHLAAAYFELTPPDLPAGENGLQNGESAPPDAPPDGPARDPAGIGPVSISPKEYRKAVRGYKAALRSARRLGNRSGEGAVLGSLAGTYFYQGEYRQALEAYTLALTIAREAGDRRLEALYRSGLGQASAALGERAKAIEHYEAGLKLVRDLGDRRSEGVLLTHLANAYAGLGKTRQAIDFHEAALAVARQAGDRRTEGANLNNLGRCRQKLGETEPARAAYNQALEAYAGLLPPNHPLITQTWDNLDLLPPERI